VVDPEIWAFEMKLTNICRATFQAQQYQAFAKRSVVVLPAGRKLSERQLKPFAAFGLGLYLLDWQTEELQVVIRPRAVGPTSTYHQLYALRQLGQSLDM